MNDLERLADDQGRLAIRPYNELFIYYLKGHLNRAAHIGIKTFIGNWEEENFSFLFFSAPADRQVAALLAEQSQAVLLDRFQMTYDEWHGGAPQTLDIAGFHIAPPWEASVGGHFKNEILLDPGVVFGTGTHATTHDCLVALEQVFRSSNITTVLDLGTGTGLLALAAARLGAQRVVAVDLNLLAVQTTLHNIRLNRLTHRIVAVRGLAENFIDFPSDLVVSNIHFDVMRRLLTASALGRTKWFVLSGLLRSQAREVASILKQQPTEILQTWERDGIWHTFLGRVR